MSERVTVPFGYNAGIPEGVTAAWGCRAIFTGGVVDTLPDRMGFGGGDTAARRELDEYLTGEIDLAWYAAAKGMYDRGELLDDDGHVLFKDDRVVVKGRAAGGYLYVCAYLRPPGTDAETE